MAEPVPSDRASALLASDGEREQTVDVLRAGAAEGRLTVDELEERTAQALNARTRAELEPLTADLPTSDGPGRGVPARRGRRGRGLDRDHLAAFVAVNLLLIVIWAATGAGYFWPIWPLVGWGIGLASESIPVCGRSRRRSSRRAAHV